MPQALLLAYDVTGTVRFRDIGLASLTSSWLKPTTMGTLISSAIRAGIAAVGRVPPWASSPSKPATIAEACFTAYDLTGEQRYLHLARAAAEWLLGRNCFSARLYDLATGACADGLDPQGPSLNQGQSR